MNTTVSNELKDGPAVVELWAGVLTGPIATLMLEESNYALVLWACSAQKSWPLHLLSVVALLLTLLAGTLACRNWRRLGRNGDEDGPGPVPRSRFMAAVGMLISLLSALVILAMWIPVFIYGPCQR